jgi:aspartyl-tRNA(Asn)/glutamyl-tRNA(Gln) amidotransferase subunit C
MKEMMMPSTSDPSSPSLALNIEREDVRRLATLARLHLTPEEEARCVTHVQTVLSYVTKLSHVNTDGIEPMAHAVEVLALIREDRVTNQPNTEALLLNAPARMDNFFVVPRIID